MTPELINKLMEPFDVSKKYALNDALRLESRETGEVCQQSEAVQDFITTLLLKTVMNGLSPTASLGIAFSAGLMIGRRIGGK